MLNGVAYLFENDVCEVTCVDQTKVNRVRAALQGHNTIDVAKIFKALSDDTRIKNYLRIVNRT